MSTRSPLDLFAKVGAILGFFSLLISFLSSLLNLVQMPQGLRSVSVAAFVVFFLAILWLAFRGTDVKPKWRWLSLGALYVVTILYFIWVGTWIGEPQSAGSTLTTTSTSTPATSLILASSTFDTDDDGWKVMGGAAGPAYQSSGGNPGGFISANDVSGGDWYWVAPEKFLKDKSAAYGGILTFDLTLSPTDNPYEASDVVLVGQGITLVFDTPYDPERVWTAYAVLLSESAEWINDDTGQAATREEMTQVLSSLSELRIRGEFARGSSDTGGLDNVMLLRRP